MGEHGKSCFTHQVTDLQSADPVSFSVLTEECHLIADLAIHIGHVEKAHIHTGPDKTAADSVYERGSAAYGKTAGISVTVSDTDDSDLCGVIRHKSTPITDAFPGDDLPDIYDHGLPASGLLDADGIPVILDGGVAEIEASGPYMGADGIGFF